MVMEAAGAIGEALGLIKPKKAKLVVVGSENLPVDLKEGEVNNLPGKPHEIEFMYNPTEYSISQSVKIDGEATAATPGGTLSYGGAGRMSVKMTMFLEDYASAKGDVTPLVTTLLDWTKPTADSQILNKPCAPRVGFVWGGNPQLSNFHGFLSSVSVNYTVFRKDGTPVQAKVEITIEGKQEPPEAPQSPLTNPTSHATKSRRIHQTVEGDTLQSVAYGELGKARYWRGIAELNGIDDPLRLAPGTTLLIPSVADAASAS